MGNVVMRRLQPVRTRPTRTTTTTTKSDADEKNDENKTKTKPTAATTTTKTVKRLTMTDESARASARQAVALLKGVKVRATRSRGARLTQLDFLDKMMQSLATRVAKLLEATRK